MSGKKKRGSARAVPRSYGRLTRHERDTVQRMLERRASCREIARELGRSPSTVSAEVASHRFVTAPKARRGERGDASADLSAACPRLAAWPRCCNGCGRYRAIGCKRRPHVFYEARAAQLCADSVLVSSRRGIDADEPAAAARLEAIRGCLRRGLSPVQMAARNGGPVDLSPSTIYRWVSAGYDGMTNMELRRKVGYRPRKRAAGRAATRHSARRSHAAFLALGEDACAAAWEMDTVEGAREDSACLLTLLHRPSRLQLALPDLPVDVLIGHEVRRFSLECLDLDAVASLQLRKGHVLIGLVPVFECKLAAVNHTERARLAVPVLQDEGL